MKNTERYYANKARKNLTSLKIDVQKGKSILANARMDLITKYSKVFGPKDCQSIMKEIDNYQRLTKGNTDAKYPKVIMDSYSNVWYAEANLEWIEDELKHFDIYIEMAKLGYDFEDHRYDYLCEEPIYK